MGCNVIIFCYLLRVINILDKIVKQVERTQSNLFYTTVCLDRNNINREFTNDYPESIGSR